MNQINYQKKLDALLEEISRQTQQGEKVPRLFLHSCCAPCSSYVLEYLSDVRLIAEMKPRYPVHFCAGRYDPGEYYRAVKGLEQIREGGERCFACYRLRMEEAARLAAEGAYDYFTTTLSISPLKNAQKINEIGEELAGTYQVRHLPSDFKKRNGYLRSIQLSREYDLYRQDYCGCVFSKKERATKKKA